MSLRPPLNQAVFRGFITWLSYTVSGLLSVSLSAPDQHVSPLFVAAGVGLALIMGWGKVALPGVALGAATVTLASLCARTPLPNGQTMLTLMLVSGLGAALQAWAGWRLTARRDGAALTLETPAEIGRFLLLAGPVACLVHPTLAVSAQLASGLGSAATAPGAWLAWWAGDTLGVLVGAPIALTLVGKPAALWRARRLLVGLPLLVVTVLLGLGIRELQVWGQQREAATFLQDAQATTNAVKLRLNGYQDALAAMGSVFEASEEVTREEFARAAQYWLHTLHGVQALGWDERLYAADLPLFETRQRQEGLANFKVFDGHERSSPTGPELAAVRYIEPQAGNEVALGYNALSMPATREAYEQARRENRVIATRGFRLMQETARQTGLVIYRPVFKGAPFTPQARVQANRGAVFMALRMDDALGAMLQGRPAYLEACLIDQTDANRPVLAGAPVCRSQPARKSVLHRVEVPIEFAGRSWLLSLWAPGPVPVVGVQATTWMVTVAGVALAASLGALLLVMTGHTRRLEAAMEAARVQKAAAEQANQAKSEFLSRMSHELRTPLNAVLGFAQVMSLDQRAPLHPSQRERVEQIQQAGWHLLDMIDDVLDISRIDMGTLQLQPVPLRVRDELTMACKLMQEEAERAGVSLQLGTEVPSTWGALADAGRLRQILSHLVSNAIQFNQRGGQVSLRAERIDGASGTPLIRIHVQDTGIGMNEAQLAQLFQPFNRLGRERGPAGGPGIGLVISQHLAQLMGGQITVTSREGEGSTFTLTLPAIDMPHKPRAAAETPTARHAPEGDMRPRHVLYVEDNQANSEVICSALAARPWIKVSVAPTTEEGLAVLHNRLRGTKPDLILLDVHLPDASGQELLRLIKANPDTADIPVIMISADAMPEQIDAALSAGAACYLTKPVQLAELLRQVDELMPA
jgi:signal transduction histidine kinase/CheY-like chemotaxis protein